jgi:hypothetical protein
MNTKDFKTKLKLITDISRKYEWHLVSTDVNSGRISFTDELSIFRIDIYTSKMTVCFLPKGDKPKFFKRQSLQMIDNIFKNPFKI